MGKERTGKCKRKVRAVSIILLLSCLAFSFTACGNVPTETVEIIQSLHDQAVAGNQVFYDIYSEEEKAADPSKGDTGLFFFRGDPGEKFAEVNC